jgi:hypothetical protein
MNPLRFLTPAQLVICLVLFFLPWIEMSCTLPPEATKGADKEELAEFRKKTGVDPTRPIGMINQSGLQIATGDSSLASDFKRIEEKMKQEVGGAGGGFKMEKDPTKEKKETAPLLFAYPVALVAAIVFALVPWVSPARKFLAMGFCLAAFGVVGLQAAIGFPLDRELKKETEKMKNMGGMFGPGGGPGGGPNAADVFKVRWKFPLYLSLLLVLGAAGTALLGDTVPARRPKKKRRYEDEDEAEDLEEDRDEDRPRRRRDRDDERDDGDEEDRPRRKRPRRDDDD